MIGDFGHSKTVHNHSKSLTMGRNVGTPGYIAPELLYESGFDNHAMEIRCKIDVWSFGCVLYEIISLRKLFDIESDKIAKIESFDTENIEITLKEFKKCGAPVQSKFLKVLKM